MKSPGVTPLPRSATLFLAAVLGAATSVAAPPMDALPMAMEAVVAPRAPAYAAPTGAPSEKLKKFDRDGDGQLDAAEFAAAQRAIRKEVGLAEATPAAEAADSIRRRVFEKFDRNGDGRLDDNERVAAQTFVADGSLLRSPEMRDEVLQRFDRNGNQRIDPEERGAVVEFFQELRNQAAPASAAPAKAKGTAKNEGKAEMKREKKAAEADAAFVADGVAGKEKVAKELAKRRQASVESAAKPVDTP